MILTFPNAGKHSGGHIVISSTGVRVSVSRDVQGRILAVTDSSGRQVRYQYSAGGDLASVTDRGTNVTRFITAPTILKGP